MFSHLLNSVDETAIQTLMHSWKEPFLQTSDGKQFRLPFELLKIEHILTNSVEAMDLVSSDNFFPLDWLCKAYRKTLRKSLEINYDGHSGYAAI